MKRTGNVALEMAELEGGDQVESFKEIGVTVLAVDKASLMPVGKKASEGFLIYPNRVSAFRLRCNTCGMVFDSLPQAPVSDKRRIPLCPNECNFLLMVRKMRSDKRGGRH